MTDCVPVTARGAVLIDEARRDLRGSGTYISFYAAVVWKEPEIAPR